MMMRYLLIFLLLAGISMQCNAQLVDVAAYKKSYPDEKYLFLKKKEAAEIGFNKAGELEITETYNEEVLYLDDIAVNFSERHIPFSNLNKLADYSAYTLIPSASKYIKKEVSEFKLIDKYVSDNFHDDHKGYAFHFPSLQQGAISYMTFTSVSTEPFLYGSYDFSREVPVIESMYEVTFPASVKIQVKEFNCENFSVKKDTIQKKGNTTYRFTLSNVKKFPSESGSKDVSYYRPKLLISIVSYEKDGKTIPVLKDTKDLAAWYCKLIGKVNNKIPDNLKTISDSIKTKYSNQEEQVKAVYYWVQDNVRYISIQEGMGGFIPTSVQNCFQQRYGDCKAMSNLLQQMLSYMGIPAYHSLVGTRSLPYSYRGVPGAFIDNHMVCTYKAPDGWKILDATGRYIPYGTIPGFIQGKEILIIKENCNFEIFDVPVVPAKQNAGIDSLYLKLEDKVLLGSGRETYSGYGNIDMNQTLLSLTATQTEKLFQNYFKKGTAKCYLKGTEVRNLNDRAKNLEIDYKVEIKDYAFLEDDEIILNPHLKRPLSSAKVDTTIQKYDTEFESKGVYTFDLVFEIPEGYQVDYMPETKSFKYDNFNIVLSYVNNGKTIRHTSTLTIDTLYITKKQFKDWNEMVNKLSKSYNDSFVLKKKL
jgi:hypothetical protein